MEKAKAEGFELGKGTSSFKANSKALAEGEPEGLCKILFRKDTEEIIGCQMIGLGAADLIAEVATAKALGKTVRDLAYTTTAHPTLSEVVDAAAKACCGMHAH